MRKGFFRGVIVAAAAMMALAGTGAHADTTVGFTTEDGATLLSAPSGLADHIEGVAGDDVAVTGVHIVLEGPMVPNIDDLEGDWVPLQTIHGDAVAECTGADPDNGRSDSCTWSYEVPFIVGPGEWTVTATAYADSGDPDNPTTVSDSISVTIL